MSRQSIASLAFAFVVFTYLAPAAWSDGLPEGRESNWHQFRGPEFTGVAPQGNPPTTWDQSTNVKWKVELPGKGLASPIVWGDKIFILTAIKTEREGTPGEGETAEAPRRTRARLVADETPAQPPAPPAAENAPSEGERRDGDRRGRGGRRGGGGGGWGPPEAPKHFHQFVVMCLDRKTGNTEWQQIATDVVPNEAHHGTASFASASPVTDGKNVYASFGSRGVYSYDMAGNFRWKYEIGEMETRNSFGEGASPALYGDTLVVNCDQEGEGKSYIVAIDANTGTERWKVQRDEATTWTTPMIVEHSGRTQVIVNGTNRARSYDLNTGEIIWECGGQAQGVVPTPIVYGDMVFMMTGHRGAALYAIPLDSTGDITDTDKVIWKRDEGTPYVPSALLYDDSLYFTKSNDAIMTCVSAETGETQFENKRLEGLSNLYASLVGANNRIYVCGRDGTTLVLKHGPTLEILATNQLGETVDATPAIVGNEIFIRGEKHLFCIAEN